MRRPLVIAGFVLWSCSINVSVDRSCPSGTMRCNERCSDTSVDLENCGQCGARCSKGQVCSNGTCGNLCLASTTLCSDHCSKLGSDPNNCGACGNICKFEHAAPTCTNGVCAPACLAAYADCDSNPTNGCEIDLATSSANCGKCGHDCLGGDCVKGRCQPAILSPGPAGDVVIDKGNIYWDAFVEIRTCSKTVCIPTILGSTGSFGRGLAIDSTNVYWTTYADVLKCAKGGCSSPTVLSPTQGDARAIATDGANVYWVASAQNNGQVWSCSVNGGPATALLPYSISIDINAAIATDGVNVYFSTRGVTEVCPVSGCMSLPNFVFGSTDALALDTTNLYVANPNLSKCALTGCNQIAKKMAPGLVRGIAPFGKAIYFTKWDTGTVERCAIDNCIPEILATTQSNLEGIAVDDEAVYFGTSKGLMRLAK